MRCQADICRSNLLIKVELILKIPKKSTEFQKLICVLGFQFIQTPKFLFLRSQRLMLTFDKIVSTHW